MEPVRLAVFASGNGSNLQALLDEPRRNPDWPARVVAVVSDKPGALAVTRAEQAGVPVFAKSPRTYPDKPAFERDVLRFLHEHGVQWITLAGYMRLVGDVLLTAYPNRILNIHPSLLPHFPGRHAVQDALAAGAKETGVTVHLVDDGIDTGPILLQARVAIPDGITEEDLLARIHKVEHKLYPLAVSLAVAGWLREE
ncbi:MAG: phosphoribosylglycinamide formyltransferase [Alicyclobacillus herbarius]|uniref:phosphoribosylglycinamide formyltransferase n=1 Tax=Alicyclobacillus herbarius TaxID=122960 RepID=UPI0023553E2B|nr:phosphoribosylglycinamide formyltransferase [Alicyclobacillus herbarius]MCL6632222.1 phosphoribosylglycinamide formyltransferase [Alicyclobacillus herbarius]